MISLLRNTLLTQKDTVTLIESLGTKELLLEISIDTLEKQWVDQGKVSKEKFDTVKDYLGDLGANYVAWFLTRCFTDKLIDFDDLDIWANRLKVFDRNNKAMTIKDLGQVKTADDLETVAKDVGDSRLKNYAKAERAFQGSSRAGESTGDKKTDPYCIGDCPTSKGSFKVYKIPANRPELFWLAKKLGAGTSWCTRSSSYYYNYYTKDGPLYVLVGKAGEKYQIHVESDQFKNKYDAEVNYAAEWVEEVYLWLQEKEGIKLSNKITQIIKKRKALLANGGNVTDIAKEILQKASTQVGDYTLVQWSKLSGKDQATLSGNEIIQSACIHILGMDVTKHYSGWAREDSAICYKDSSTILAAVDLKSSWAYRTMIQSYGKDNTYATIQKEPKMFGILIQLFTQETVRRELRGYYINVMDTTLPRLEDFPEEQLEGTKFKVRILESKTEGDLKGVYEALVGNNVSDYRIRKIIVVSLSDDAYLCHCFEPDWYKENLKEARTFTDIVKVIQSSWNVHNTGAAIWDRPFEFWFSFWKPFLNFIQKEEGLQMPLDNLEDIKSVGKYGHKGELLASRYSIQGLSSNIATVYRIPSNRLDLPGTLGCPNAKHEGLLIKYSGEQQNSLDAVYIENYVERIDGREPYFSAAIYRLPSAGGRYNSRTWLNCGNQFQFNERRYSRWVPSDLRPVIKKAIAYLSNNIDKDITKEVYDDIYLKTPEQQTRELARRERAAEREARRAEREARQAERAAERAARPERQPRARQAQQEPQQTVAAPQQQQPQEYVPAADATPGTEYGPARIQYSTGQADLLRDAKVIEWEDGMQRLNPQQVARLESERGDLNTKVLLDRATGNIYVYFMDNRGVIVKRYTSSRNNLLVLNPEYMKRSNEQHRQELTPRQRQQLGLDEVKERVKPRRRESLLKDLATIKKDYMKGGPVVFKIGKLGEEED